MGVKVVWYEAGGVMAAAILHLWWEVGERGGAGVHFWDLTTPEVRCEQSASVFLWNQLRWQQSWGGGGEQGEL